MTTNRPHWSSATLPLGRPPRRHRPDSYSGGSNQLTTSPHFGATDRDAHLDANAIPNANVDADANPNAAAHGDASIDQIRDCDGGHLPAWLYVHSGRQVWLSELDDRHLQSNLNLDWRQ